MKKLLFIISIICFIIYSQGFVFADSGKYSSTTTIEVKKGDTLWNVACSVSKNKKNLNELMFDIKKLNKLDSKSSVIYPGQTLIVPVIE